MNPRKATHEDLLHHVVLPRILPTALEKCNIEEQELMLVDNLTSSIQQCDEYLPPLTIKFFKKFKQLHEKRDAHLIWLQINELQPGETFAMFLKSQHTVFMIRMPKEEPDIVNVATFPSRCNAKEIYGANSNDLQMTYPAVSLDVEFSKMIRSKDFAQQLCYAYNITSILKKGGGSWLRNHCNGWLMMILNKGGMCETDNFPRVTKKIRDEIIGIDENRQENHLECFQRSDYYMVMKVLLQINLKTEMNNNAVSKFVYKIVMLHFMMQLCGQFVSRLAYPKLNVDLMTQTLAKIARRIEKLSLKYEKLDCDSFSIRIIQFYFKTVRLAKEIISDIRKRIDAQIWRLQNDCEISAKLKPLKDLNFDGDIDQQVPTLRSYLNNRKVAYVNLSIDVNVCELKESKRHTMANDAPLPINLFQTTENDTENRLHLCDAENWLLYALNLNDIQYDCEHLQSWYTNYVMHAEELHIDDPLAISQMLLVRLKLVAMIDRITAQKYPLLLEHRCGIDTEIFDILLLPQSQDMAIAAELRKYFGNRNANSDHPSLIGEDHISDRSFSVRFANNSTEMQKLCKQILDISREKVNEKRNEWEACRKKSQMLHAQSSRLKCSQSLNQSQWSIEDHRKECEKCSVIHKIENIRLTQYQHPLPTSSNHRDAIVFELQMPLEIAILRDILHSTTKFGQTHLIRMPIKDETECWNLRKDLADYNQSRERKVLLGSSKSTAPITCHVDDHDEFDSFIAENDSNCVFHEARCELFSSLNIEIIRKKCTFIVEPGSPYASLQWTFHTTTDTAMHTQNQVLARQSECPENLTLAEFIEFGSLRADGHRLQIRKLYAMISSAALSFDQPSVLSLILQTLWETGISNEFDPVYDYESHKDFISPDFTLAMVDLLKEFVDQQTDNWAHPIKLMCAVFIAVRIFELSECIAVQNTAKNEYVLDELLKLMDKIRAILMDWLKKIQNVLHGMALRCQSDEKALRWSLALVSITAAMTFFVNPKHKSFVKVFQKNASNDYSAPRTWLESIITLNKNILMNNRFKDNSKLNLNMFMRLVQSVGIHIEPKIREMIQADTTDLIELIKKQWPKAARGECDKVYFAENCPQTVIVDVRFGCDTSRVSIDIVSGLFLVDGIPVNRLPKKIVEDPLYRRIFNDHVFEVQWDGTEKFSTVHTFNDCTYEFEWSSEGKLIISERRTQKNKQPDEVYELIPQTIFSNDIPMLLIEKHSHWWNKETNIIEFRPIKFTDKHFSDGSGNEYQLNVATKRLLQMKINQRPMLDINSCSYKQIQTHVSRLEEKKYILVVLEKPKVATVELLRLNLKFKIDTTKAKMGARIDMVSNEFKQYRISLQQNCGTLYGLQHGLLLEPIPTINGLYQSKLMIVPHAKMHCNYSTSHGIANINVGGELRNPAFHQYQVDNTLKQLKPCNESFSAWFYLAYLHAITSHGEIEPLTGMSGTERAHHILQLSLVWSSAPYDTEAIKTLQMISHLSPARQLSPKGNYQHIRWPHNIPEHCAQDSFIFITQKLIADSQRLIGLYGNETVTVKDPKDPKCLELNKRDYLRNLQLRPNLRIQDTFIEYPVLKAMAISKRSGAFPQNVRRVATLYHDNTCQIPHNKLKTFLMSKLSIYGPTMNTGKAVEFLNHHMHDLKQSWLSLYEIARKKSGNPEQFGLLWSLMAHDDIGGNLDAILILQTVEKNPYSFRNINPPAIGEFRSLEECFDSDKVSDILKKYYKDSKGFSKCDEIQEITDYVKTLWPCDRIDLNSYPESIKFNFKNLDKANKQLNNMLSIWYNNLKLTEFIEEVENKLRKLRPVRPSVGLHMFNLQPVVDTKQKPKYQINFDKKMTRHLDECQALKEAKTIWYINENSNRTAAEWWTIYLNAVQSTDDKHLIDAGLFPRLVPTLIFPQITNKNLHPDLKAIVGVLALATAHEQRTSKSKQSTNQPQYADWKPSEYPEWLLFEIERDLTIRPIQIRIAKRMIDPPDIGTKHSVMQLNMGEGKTAVIVPILASVLANGEQACQIVVLKSLFATNLNSLRQYLGGMLQRRIYIFPCRRDLPIAESVTKLLKIYEECKEYKGVILTIPEYFLSFKLKLYETAQKGNADVSANLLKTQQWIHQNVRCILDESDAILHPKYQLIYTIGNQRPLDGGTKRWIVAQAVLKRVPFHVKNMYEQNIEYKEKIEYDEKYLTNAKIYGEPMVDHRSDIFPPCRILDEKVYDEFVELLIDDFIEGRLEMIEFPEMRSTAKKNMKQYLSNRTSDGLSDEVKRQITTVHLDILLILSGLLNFGILKLILTRRWRVNYGVNEKGSQKMAIPFKAKDVPTEKTDFGHPDVAIGFTQLSYYYSGLTDKQLYRVFEVLSSNPNASGIYDKWISSISDKLIETSIKSYSGINLEDPTQRNKCLFPLLRHNMYVIDFWLNVDIFSREAKTFEKKLICTAWDLASGQMEHRVTGFSGTNDTKNILPLPIAQNDLEELQQTNEEVRETLKRTENQGYFALEANFSSQSILEKLVNDNIPVLLDAGALMLDRNNEQMAYDWLTYAQKQKKNFDAAVYFDAKDVLQTIDQNGVIVELNCSVYRDNLSRCLVYIDDAHIRGTDLKFPMKWKGCVTLSGDITYDKTVQACMRMRDLGKGHAIAFWASHEADIRIKKECESEYDFVSNEHVIKFIRRNSEQVEKDNAPYWITAALNYTKKLASYKFYENSIEPNALIDLSEKCLDDEIVSLKDIYGEKKWQKLSDISQQKFKELEIKFAIRNDIVQFVRNIDRKVCEKLDTREMLICQFGLDEEQEKEMEQETEQEYHIERPFPAKPKIPKCHDLLVNFLLNAPKISDQHMVANKIIIPMRESLDNTTFYDQFKNERDAWSANLCVSKDFKRVLDIKSDCDEFLRPVWWIAGIKSATGICWLILSSFECNELLPIFETSPHATLFMYRSRTNKTQNNLLHEQRLQVTGMINPLAIDLRLEIEIGVFGGSMFFKSDAEQNTFCDFIGSIPRPRTSELEQAFSNGLIQPNGFVPIDKRKTNPVSLHVGGCRFNENPNSLVISLIIAHHHLMRKECHVASIVERGVKCRIEVAADDQDAEMVDDIIDWPLCVSRSIRQPVAELDPPVWKKIKLEPIDPDYAE